MDSHIAYLLVDGMEPYMDSCIDEHLTILLLKQSNYFEIKQGRILGVMILVQSYRNMVWLVIALG